MNPVYVTRAREVAARKIGPETMIMSARDSTLFSLNETASAIWHAADGVTPLAAIVEEKICKAFEIDRAVAMSDAEALVNDLVSHGILRLSAQPLQEIR